jgi:hypothetical protein
VGRYFLLDIILLCCGGRGCAAACEHWPDDMAQQTGQLRQGLACMPSGSFMLADVNLPTTEALSAAIPEHLTAQIQQVRVGICSAYMGIGKAPATTIKLVILWKDQRNLCERIVETSARVKKSDARFNSQPMMIAISQSLQEYRRITQHDASCAAESLRRGARRTYQLSAPYIIQYQRVRPIARPWCRPIVRRP